MVKFCSSDMWRIFGIFFSLTDHHPAGLLAEVAPVAVDERPLELRGGDLSRVVRVHRPEPGGDVGVHLRGWGASVACQFVSFLNLAGSFFSF